MTVPVTSPPRPAIAPPGPWSFPPVERARLSNGIELHSYHRPGQQIVAAHLVLEVPLSAEPREREGRRHDHHALPGRGQPQPRR